MRERERGEGEGEGGGEGERQKWRERERASEGTPFTSPHTTLAAVGAVYGIVAKRASPSS